MEIYEHFTLPFPENIKVIREEGDPGFKALQGRLLSYRAQEGRSGLVPSCFVL